MNRRKLLQTTLATGAATAWLVNSGMAKEEAESFEIIDSNVSLFQWPFRRLPCDTADELATRLRSHRVVTALAGSFEGLLHRDVRGVNARLAKACSEHPGLIPVGCVNPGLPGWEDDLKECAERYAMPGVRLHPNYHGYSVEDEVFGRVLELAARSGLFVQMAVAMEDTRTQHPLVQVPDVDFGPLPSIVKDVPGVQVQVLNLRPRGTMAEFKDSDSIVFDTARADGSDGVAKLINAVGVERVLYGSHSPFLIPEAALIRVHESNLSVENLRRILRDNIGRLIQ